MDTRVPFVHEGEQVTRPARESLPTSPVITAHINRRATAMNARLRLAVPPLFVITSTALRDDPEKPTTFTGKDALGDWTTDAPGVRRRITLDDLAEPYDTPSANKFPKVVERPDGAWPKARKRSVTGGHGRFRVFRQCVAHATCYTHRSCLTRPAYSTLPVTAERPPLYSRSCTPNSVGCPRPACSGRPPTTRWTRRRWSTRRT